MGGVKHGDLFLWLSAHVSADWQAQAAWREQADDDFAFVAGHQWSDLEEHEMKEASRIPIVFNRVAPLINSVAGFEINNRTQVRFIPREIGDVKPNEIISAGADWYRDESDAEDEESQAFQDLLTCGIGFTETALDFDLDAEGKPQTPRIPPTEMCWDRFARRKGLQDARRIARVHEMPLAEAKEMFPGFDEEELHAGWLDKPRDSGRPNINIAGDQYRAGNSARDDGADRETVTVVQAQWRERVKAVEYVDPQSRERAEMPADQWAKLVKTGVPVDMIPHRTVSRWEWRQAFLGSVVLQENAPCKRASTFTAITGHYDAKLKHFYGLLRLMRDPQRYANKWLSTTLHIIASNAKGGVMVEEDAVSDAREFEESWAAADGVTWLKPGRAAGIIPKPGVQFPAAMVNLTEFAVSSIRDTTGVNLELLGMREANQPGILEYQRRQSAMTTLAHFFDALRFYRKRQGEVILHFLRDYIAPSGRLVRIVKDDQEQFVSLAMEIGTRAYDVIIDDSPSAPNEKERTWSIISELMPLLMNAGLGAEDWADILEYSPLPSSFAEKVRAKAAQHAEQPDPAQEAAVQAQIEEMQAKIERLRSQSQLDQARAAQIVQETQVQPMRIEMDAAKAQADVRLREQAATVQAMKAASSARKDDAASIASLMRPPSPTGA